VALNDPSKHPFDGGEHFKTVVLVTVVERTMVVTKLVVVCITPAVVGGEVVVVEVFVFLLT
jgi:hypothetical protein